MQRDEIIALILKTKIYNQETIDSICKELHEYLDGYEKSDLAMEFGIIENAINEQLETQRNEYLRSNYTNLLYFLEDYKSFIDSFEL